MIKIRKQNTDLIEDHPQLQDLIKIIEKQDLESYQEFHH